MSNSLAARPGVCPRTFSDQDAERSNRQGSGGKVRLLAAADSRFFVGAAALLDSLRVSGNPQPAFIVDIGLSADQRSRIAPAADLLRLPPAQGGLDPLFAKLTADLFWQDGIVVLLDGDMIVTGPLDDLIDQAARGRIAVHPDHESNAIRQFPEWEGVFGLKAPLRHQPYVNTAPVAFSLEHWPTLLERWRAACRRLPEDWATHPATRFADQDAFNAVLMSEIPADALWIGSPDRTVHADALVDVEIADPRSLECRFRGTTPILLHYGLSPKAWESHAWSRIRPADAYVRLLRRLLFARDVPVRARVREVPPWLWPYGCGAVAAGAVRLLFRTGTLNFFRRSRDRAVQAWSALVSAFR